MSGGSTAEQISSTEWPRRSSESTRPSGVTSMTHRSVTI